MKYLQVPTGLWRWVLLGALALAGCRNDQQGSSALVLAFNDGICSGTAVGPAEVVTAAHCFEQTSVLAAINGVPVEGYMVVPSGTDVVRVHLSAPRFKSWSRFVGTIVRGDRVTWNGNPIGMQDILREGYMAGRVEGAYLIAAPTCKGDSGSGVFNARGELVGVVSKIIARPGELCGGLMIAEPV